MVRFNRPRFRFASYFPCFVAAVVLGAAAHAQVRIDSGSLEGLRYREIGPFNGGRVLAVSGVASNPNLYYFGAVAGGVWKTTDAGLNWTPLFDDQPVSSIGALAVAESDPNVIYVGTGEACIRGDISHGDGVYKSIDAGRTWKNIGLRDTRHIGRVIVHPRNPDLLFVAALGHAYGPNSERGVFRSRNGGETWEKVLYKDENTGAIDIVFDPSNPNIIYAGLWEVYRTPYSLESGGPGSGIYRSIDGGTTWKHLTGSGLPKGIMGKIGLAVASSEPDRVYALIDARDGGLFRSDNAGDTWRLVNDDPEIRQRAFYYIHVNVDPKNADVVYFLQVSLLKSIDGGRTFSSIREPHGDNHGMWIDPNNPQRLIVGTDGGPYITTNGGRTWTEADLPISQFYHVSADNRTPYYVYGAMQDLSTAAIPSDSLSREGITQGDWYPVGGGESGYVVPHTKDPNIVYAGSYSGLLTRYDHRTRQAQRISPWPEHSMGWGAGELKYRFQWTAPIATSPYDPDVVYHAANVLFKSVNGGKSWTAISPDLTRNDKSKLGPSGGPITHDNTTVEYYCTIFTVAESPKQKDLIWAGSDDGLLHITADGGKNWINVTPKGMPEWSRLSMVEPSPHEASTAYLAADRHQLDDFKPYAYKTNDYGKTWTSITNGIPSNTYVRVVREDPSRRGLLYAGTETGVFVSFDDGAYWQSMQLNLPTSPVHDLIVKDGDLVVGTHGRSIWILDDITPLRQLTPQVVTENAHLFQPRPTFRRKFGAGGEVAPPPAAGDNPPAGALIRYNLKSPAANEVKLEILDSKGQAIHTFSSNATNPRDQLPARGGLNSFVWDLRYPEASRFPGLTLRNGGGLIGPVALPGTYQLRLTAAGAVSSTSLVLKPDQRVSTPMEELEAQFNLLIELRDTLTSAHDAITGIRSIRRQLTDLIQRVGSTAGSSAIVQAAKDLDAKMTKVEETIYQTKARSTRDTVNYPIRINDKLAYLVLEVSSADTAPTKQSYELGQMLSGQIKTELTNLNSILSKDLAALNELVRKQNIPPIAGPAPAGVRQR